MFPSQSYNVKQPVDGKREESILIIVFVIVFASLPFPQIIVLMDCS